MDTVTFVKVTYLTMLCPQNARRLECSQVCDSNSRLFHTVSFLGQSSFLELLCLSLNVSGMSKTN